MSQKVKTSTTSLPVPVRLLKQISSIPAFVSIMEKYHDDENHSLSIILDLAKLTTFSRQPSDEDIAAFAIIAEQINIIRKWNKTRQIYTFNPGISQILNEQPLTGNLPHELLKQLPAKCFYIQASIDPEFDGFFVEYLDVSTNESSGSMLVFYPTSNNLCSLSYPLPLKPDKPLLECLKDSNLVVVNGEERDLGTNYENSLNLYEKMLNHCLYLCADNRDVTEKKHLSFSPRSNTGKKKKKAKNSPKPTDSDSFNEWAVGDIVIKEYQKSESSYVQKDRNDTADTGGTKRPHFRRAHWHAHWTGSKDDPNGQRLIFKWHAPVFVNGNERKGRAVIVHNVQPAKKKK